MTEEKLRVAAVVPSLNPDDNLFEVIRELTAAGFDDIIVVNDGSDPDCAHYFETAAEMQGVTLLVHEVNRGKGAAIRTALAYLDENRPDTLGAVTVDADNQHRAADAVACARAMLTRGEVILGVRDFSKDGVPLRSRLGNRITSTVMLLFCGMRISDTQTGLRAFPREHFAFLCGVTGDRYEYETNMLLEMKAQGVPFSEVAIETVYLNENRGSHFNALRDSFRIYLLILKFVLSSFVSFGIDYLLFSLALLLLGHVGLDGWWRIAVATVFARAFSSVCNFMLNRRVVFKNSGHRLHTLFRYYCLAIPQMCVSAGLVWCISHLLGGTGVVVTTLLKLAVDIVLFFASFRIQREWVFRERKKEL